MKKSESAVGKVSAFSDLQLRWLKFVLQDATEGEKESTIKVEKTKKVDAWKTGKSATMFSAWLSKPTIKPSTSESKPTKILVPSISDFESTFRPFAVRKKIDLAPNNYFMEQAESKNGKVIIELNDDGEQVGASRRPQVKSITPYPKGAPPVYLREDIIDIL